MISTPSFDPATRDYYEQIAARWHTHPPDYVSNRSWQQKMRALQQWIRDHNLVAGKVLEIGCGSGLLQHLVPDYTGLDLAAGAGAFLHKPFCNASATRLPFPDNTFDAAWSIWTIEHVQHPQEMLDEMRRVVKPGGTVFLCAGYAVDPWIGQGLHKRPFRDLPPAQWPLKVLMPILRSPVYRIAAALGPRFGDMLGYLIRRQPTALRYRAVEPSYSTYWDYDADASVMLDAYNVALYFLSRGDQPYFAGGIMRSLLLRSQAQAYTVCKA